MARRSEPVLVPRTLEVGRAGPAPRSRRRL